MADLGESARRLYRRVVAEDHSEAPEPGRPALLRGRQAIQMLESMVCGREILPGGGREALAAAMGLALAGQRGTALLSGPDLLASLDLVGRASDLRLPLVAHLEALAGNGATSVGSGHGAYHVAADTGWILLFATNVQEAVDLTLAARKMAETALAPCLVATDGPETAGAVQDLLFPETDAVRRLLGSPEELIGAPTPSQDMLFGSQRPRVPRWHDVERPLLSGAGAGTEAFATAAAGRHAYFDAHLPSLVDSALRDVGRQTGRAIAAVDAHRLKGADLVLVAQGAAFETAVAVAEHLRSVRGPKVGVLGLRVARPWPASRLIELLAGRKQVVVLERVDSTLASDPPLLREIRATLERARENQREESEIHRGIPALHERQMPRLAAVSFGLGGLPLRSRDLVALCRELATSWRPQVFLGVDFDDPTTTFPKRRATLDRLSRRFPEAARLGLRSREPAIAVTPASAVTVSFHRLAGRGGEEQLPGEVAGLLHRLRGGFVRSRPETTRPAFGDELVARVDFGPEPIFDPGDEVPAALAVWAPIGPDQEPDLDHLETGGALLFAPPVGSTRDADILASLPRSWRRQLARGELSAFALPESSPNQGNRSERLLGAVIGVLRTRGVVDESLRKLLDARREMLAALPSTDREALLADFQAGLDQIRLLRPNDRAESEGEPLAEEMIPTAARRGAQSGEDLGSLPHFWDQTAILYRRHRAPELVPDPFLATGTVPARAAGLRQVAAARILLPELDPAACTGCGACWTACPEGAVGPWVLGAGALLEQGMELAKRAGANSDALRMVSGKLATRIGAELAASETDGADTGMLLDGAFTSLISKSPLPEARKEAVTEAFGAVRDALAGLPVSRTGTFFTGPEATAKGEGELLFLAIDPDACKGCGICVRSCEPGALTSLPDGPERTAAARRRWDLARESPFPTAETVARAQNDPDVGALAGALLGPEARDLLVGGDGAEAGSGEKVAVRQLLGAMAHHLRPRRQQLSSQLSELREQLAAAIHSGLARALPEGDLDALAQGLDTLSRPDADLAELTSRVESAFESERVDAPRLRRLVSSAQELADLAWRLEHGPTGLGRAPFGLVIGPGLDRAWATTFPSNSFAVPLVYDATGDGGDLARGIVEANQLEAAAWMGALRRARQVLDERGAPRSSGQPEPGLRWPDLTAEEKRLWPPLLMLAAEPAAGGHGAAGWLHLLGSDLPVTVILLAKADLGFGRPGGSSRAGGELEPELLSLAFPRALVVQTSIAHPDHLDRGVAAALEHSGPALVRVHAPSPEAHGFEADRTLERAADAVASRVFPLLRSTPRTSANHGLDLDLSENPTPEETWHEGLTPVHWALAETRFASRFEPLGEDPTAPTPIAPYLTTAPADRTDQTPVVAVDTDGGERRVGSDLVIAAEHRLGVWRLLQGLAFADRDLVTAAAVEAEERALAAAGTQHAEEVAALHSQHASTVDSLRRDVERELALRVRERLMALASHPPESTDGEAPSA